LDDDFKATKVSIIQSINKMRKSEKFDEEEVMFHKNQARILNSSRENIKYLDHQEYLVNPAIGGERSTFSRTIHPHAPF
jgi:hypothetical protein